MNDQQSTSEKVALFTDKIGRDLNSKRLFYDRFVRSVKPKYGLSVEDCEDIFQLTAFNIISQNNEGNSRIDTYRHVIDKETALIEDESLSSWFIGCLDNACIDYLRRENSIRRGGGHDRIDNGEFPIIYGLQGRSESPLDGLIRKEDGKRLWVLLDELEEQQKELLVMHYVDGLTYSEISDELGVPKGTLKSWVGRSKNKLRRIHAA
ncbi:hypothetical protein CMI42_04540 [Candidatus Pacearchaeota archaeon]|nr:hypothetical protein [Candidatus Pacearchaeota archaeon]|tara:strand:- start:632 stop:1252 length:621 start_codon:yes stop_codon:yes gene_type:complete